MLKRTLGTWLAATGLMVGSWGCVVVGDDGNDTNATNASAGSTGMNGGSGSSGEAEESSGGAAEGSGGGDSTGSMEEECDPECEPGQVCVQGICVGDSDPGTSDYGPCTGACPAGEQGVILEGLEGFCFCSPSCDGMGSMCPDPTEGSGVPVCALVTEQGADPSQCVLACQSPDDCPSGAQCLELQPMVSVCIHPMM